MIKVTSRYLASHFIPPFILGFVFFVAFLITFYMFRIISMIVNKGIDLKTVLGMVLNLSVSFFPLAAPLAIFFATIYTLNKLSEDSEIIALRSFGITKFKIFFPFLVVGGLVGGMILALNSHYIPYANGNFKNTVLKLTSAGVLNSIKSEQFFTDIPNVTLFAENVSDDGNSFENIFLNLSTKGSKEQTVIFAKSGSLVKLNIGSSEAASLRMHLMNGNIVKIDSSGNEVEKTLFKEYDFPIFNSKLASGLLNKDSMKNNSELKHTIEEKRIELKKLLGEFQIKKELKDYQEILKEAKKSLVKSEIEYFARFVIFPQIILFVFLGFSLGIKKGRGRTGSNTIIATIVLISYYSLYFFLISLAQRGIVLPIIASFLPCIIIALIAAYYFKKLDWVG